MEKNIINIDAHVIDDIRTIITRARTGRINLSTKP